jgi:hypothetical protein
MGFANLLVAGESFLTKTALQKMIAVKATPASLHHAMFPEPL